MKVKLNSKEFLEAYGKKIIKECENEPEYVFSDWHTKCMEALFENERNPDFEGLKLLVAGSRSITYINLELYIPPMTGMIISGGASGIDALAELYADKHRISKTILRPRYDKYKKSAPLKRNDKMVEMCDLVLIFWDGKSRGTKHTIDYAEKIGKPMRVYNYLNKKEA